MAANSKKNQAPVDQSLVDEQLVAPPVTFANFEAVAKAAAAEDIADAPVEPDQEDDELERLVAEQKANNARIKELKAMQPTVSRLDKVIQRQREQPAWLGKFVNTRIAERVKAGQPYEAAVEQVLHYFRTLVDTPAPADPASAE